MSTNNSTRTAFCNQYCFCNTELRTAIITKIKGLSIQTQQNTFVLFTLFKLTLDERKTLTKISTRETSHNRSPNQRTPWTTKKQGENPPLKGKQQVIQKRDVCSCFGLAPPNGDDFTTVVRASIFCFKSRILVLSSPVLAGSAMAALAFRDVTLTSGTFSFSASTVS